MKNLIRNQRGVTFLGWVVILAILGFFVLLGLRLFPLYNEKLSVIATMNAVANRTDAGKLSTYDVYKYFLRNADVNGLRRFLDRNVRDHVSVVRGSKRGEPRRMRVQYESRKKLFFDIYLLLDFDHSVPLKGEGTGES